MESKVPTREEAFDLLKEYNQSESLVKHALAVEGVMRYCARKRGEDEEKWVSWDSFTTWTMKSTPTSIAKRPRKS